MEIRKYIPSDKPRLRYICKQTAEGIFKHSEKTLEAAAIIYNDYFTENESDNIFVLADDNDNAVGYIICSSDYNKFMKLNSSVYLKRVIKASPVLSSALIGYMFCLKCIKNKSVHLLIRLQHSFAVVDNLTDLLLNVLKVFCRLFIVNSMSELY